MLFWEEWAAFHLGGVDQMEMAGASDPWYSVSGFGSDG